MAIDFLMNWKGSAYSLPGIVSDLSNLFTPQLAIIGEVQQSSDVYGERANNFKDNSKLITDVLCATSTQSSGDSNGNFNGKGNDDGNGKDSNNFNPYFNKREIDPKKDAQTWSMVWGIFDYVNTARNLPTSTLTANVNSLLGNINGGEGLTRYLGQNTESDLVRLFGNNQAAATNLALASINNPMDQTLTDPRVATYRILYYAYYNERNAGTAQQLFETVYFLEQSQLADLQNVISNSPSNPPSNPGSNS